MKKNIRRLLALFLALLLAMPSFAFAEDLDVVISENVETPVEEAGTFELGDPQPGDGDLSLSEGLTLFNDDEPGDIEEGVLELGGEEGETSDEETEPASPFEASVTLDGAVIAVTAGAGVFPEGAALRVEAVSSDAAARAVEAAAGVEGVYVHRLYRVEVVDGENDVILPDLEQGVPAVRVDGLNLPAGTRVAVYDEAVNGAYEIGARVDEGAIAFELAEAGVYDIFTVEAPTEAQEEAPAEQPAEGDTEAPAQQPAEGDTEAPAQQPAEGEAEAPAQQPTEGEAEEPAEGEVEEPAEGEVEEPALAMEEEMPSFEQSELVNGVVVTVKAEPGVFPANAVLKVQRVPTYRARQADAAIGEVRGEDENVAASYTFDIKVIDPDTREELQPAEGQKVSVSFSMEQVADQNLETNVYHIHDSGAAEKLDVTREDEVTATVETEGFSLYTVEFVYNDLEFVMQGHSQLSLQTILEALGLTGEVEAVSVSDESLFFATNVGGEWIVTSRRAFDTTEWMAVTIGGVTYEITVTDDQLNDYIKGTAITYVDENGNTTTTTDYTWLEANTTVLLGGVYVTHGLNVTPDDPELPRIVLYNDTTLVIGSGGMKTKGIYTANFDLTICKVKGDANYMIVGEYGIYGYGSLTLRSGKVDVDTLSDDSPAFGAQGGAFIKGGELKAKGGNGGALGGKVGGKVCPVTISGGTVTAKNENKGAAIGGGYGQAGNVTITGGTVDARAYNSAAIGNGMYGSGGSVTITGGTVYAKGRSGIGGGYWERYGYCMESGPITITGGNVTAESWGGRNSGICTRFTGGAGLTLGWTNQSDRVTGNFIGKDYQYGRVRFQDGKYFWLGDTSTAAMPANLDGRTLIPSSVPNIARGNFYLAPSSALWRTQTAPMGAKLSDPGDPFAGRAGYVFTGWKQGGYSGSAWNFDTPVNGEVDLYADYNIMVTVKTNNGQPDQTVQVARGGKLTRPADPTQSSATFRGWKVAGGGDYDFSAAVTEPFTLEAQWAYQGIAYVGGVTSQYTAMSQLSGTTLETGDYVVTADQTIENTLTVSGTVNLILMDGKTLTASNGIVVNEGNTLNIYAQAGGTGKLVSTGANNTSNAGIGSKSFNNSGVINIYGGIVEAQGQGAGAGIGGGTEGRGYVNIYGGSVTARPGGVNSAAIGGGSIAGAEVTIYGGTVRAYGSLCAGIGGGRAGSNIRVTIYGGSIEATAKKGAGIGAGWDGSDATVTFQWDGDHKGPITLNDTRISNPTFEGSFMVQETGELADADNIGGKTIVPAYAIRFDGNGAEGEMAARGVAIGGAFTLPGCDFTAPQGKTFVCWTAEGAEYQPGQSITPTGDLTLSALWLTPQTLAFESVTEQNPDGAVEKRYGDGAFTNALTGANTAVTWYSSDATVATVNASGQVTLAGAGTTTIHATAARSGDYAAAEARYTLTVLPKIVNDPTVTVAGGSTYTGAAITPAVTVKDGDTAIPAGEYTVSYKDNVKAGTATVTVTDVAGGGYDLDTATATFAIAPRSVTVSGIAARNKHYDADTKAELDFSGVSFSGLVTGNDLTVTADGAFDTADYGAGKTVNITNLTLGGRDAGNYTLTTTAASTTATIYAPHTVNFVYGETVLATQNVLNGKCATEPSLLTAPVKEGYRFVGWNLNGAAFDLDTPLDYDTTQTLTLTPRFSLLYPVYALGRDSGDSGTGHFSWTSSGGGTADDISGNAVDDSLLAVAGDTITVTAIPDEGDIIARFSMQYYYKYGSGEYVWTDIPCTVTESSPNQATFTVPEIPEKHDDYDTTDRRVYVSGSFAVNTDALILEKDESGAYLVGSQQDFFKLKKWMELDNDYMAGDTVKLTQDIDLTGTGFSGLGQFSGTFDGDGHAITGWAVNHGNDDAGFFQQINEGGTVKNLTLKGSVSGSGQQHFVGGVAAYNSGTITDCVCKVTVSDHKLSTNGGIVGYNYSGTVQNCQYLGRGGSYGDTAMEPVGIGTATGCTALYSIEGSENENEGIVTIQSDIDDYYPAETVVTLSLYASTRVGWTLNGFKYRNKQNEEVNLTDNPDGTYTLTVPETNVILLPNYSYDALASLEQDGQNRYLIKTKEDLQKLADVAAVMDGCRDMSFLLNNDLEDVGVFGGIAQGGYDDAFKGIFDGGGHTISGMTITAGADNVGFIGYLSGTLQNLTLENCQVTNSNGNAGMLAGYAVYATNMTDCMVKGGCVSGAYAGAICGSSVSGSNNLYTSDVTVISGSVTKKPGECGTADGDSTYKNAAALGWTVSFIDGFDGKTVMAAPQFVANQGTAEKPASPTVPDHDHRKFADKWQRANGTEYTFDVVLDEDNITADTTLYAVYNKEATYEVTLFDGDKTNIVLDVFQSDAADWQLPPCGFITPRGKVFDKWLYNNDEYSVGDKITFSDAIILTAKWKDVDYTITAETAEHGTISAKETAHYGENVTVNVNPDTGYVLDTLSYKTDIYGDSVEITATEGVYTFEMPAQSVTLTATFKPVDYTITATLDHGTLWLNRKEVDLTQDVTAHYGDTVSIFPDRSYALASVSVKQGETDVPVTEDTFTMPAGDVTVSATFAVARTITFDNGGGTGSMDPVTVAQNSTYLLPDASAFTAPEGKVFKEWSVQIGTAEAVSKQPNETIAVTANTTVTAVWETIPEVTYFITIPDTVDFGTLTTPEDDTAPDYVEGTFTVNAETVSGLENTSFYVNVYVSPQEGKTDFDIVNKADPDIQFTYEIKDLAEGTPLCGFKAAGSYTGTARLDQRQLRHYSMPQIVGEYSGQMVFYSRLEIDRQGG